MVYYTYMKKTILTQAIKDLTQQLISAYKPEKIILFGWAARGDTTSSSDIDLLIIKEDVPHYGYKRMYEVRRLIKKNVPADFLVYKPQEMQELTASKEPFITSILEEGKVLYE